MQGVVQKIRTNDKGTRIATIEGKDYFFGRDVNEFPDQGAKIEFEYNEFGEDRGRGKPRSIQRWRPVVSASGKPETGSTLSEADILRSVSNVVGNACAAGTVKAPEELEKWFVAAWAGFARRTKALNGAKPDPEFDDDLPESAYEGLPEANGNMQRAGSKW